MMPARRSLVWLAGAIALAGAAGCAAPTDTVLECSAGDIRHILRVRASGLEVDDLSFDPVKHGQAEVTDEGYVLRFVEPRDRYETIFRITKATGSGTRDLFDDEQQAIRGHGGSDAISCTPYSGRLMAAMDESRTGQR